MKRKLSKKEQAALERKRFIESNRNYDAALYGFVHYNIHETNLARRDVVAILAILYILGVEIDAFGTDDKTRTVVADAKCRAALFKKYFNHSILDTLAVKKRKW